MFVLAGLLGATLGSSTNPDVWVAVAVVVIAGRRNLVPALALAAFFLVSVRVAWDLVYPGVMQTMNPLSAVFATMVWGLIGVSIRSARERRRAEAPDHPHPAQP